MNTDVIQGSLKELKGEMKQTWSRLTDDDLSFIDGGVDQFIGKFQKTYGLTKEKASEEFEKFRNKNSHFFSDLKENRMNQSNSTVNGMYDTASRVKNAIPHQMGHQSTDEYIARAKEAGASLVDRTTGIVKEHPGYTLLGAATVGFLVGSYFSRRISR